MRDAAARAARLACSAARACPAPACRPGRRSGGPARPCPPVIGDRVGGQRLQRRADGGGVGVVALVDQHGLAVLPGRPQRVRQRPAARRRRQPASRAGRGRRPPRDRGQRASAFSARWRPGAAILNTSLAPAISARATVRRWRSHRQQSRASACLGRRSMTRRPEHWRPRRQPRAMAVVALSTAVPPGSQRLEDLGLGVGDAGLVGEILEMHRLDGGDQRDMGRARRESGAISPAWFMPISITASGRLAGMRASVSGTPIWLLKLFAAAWVGALGGQHCAQHLLGPGLADRAGDADHPRTGAQPRARREAAQRLQRAQRVVHEQRASSAHALGPMGRPSPRRRRGQCVGDEAVAVARAACQRDEQVARRDRRAVDLDAGAAHSPGRPPRGGGGVGGGPERRGSQAPSSPSSAATAARRGLGVVERVLRPRDLLPGLVPLSGDQEAILRPQACRRRAGWPRRGRRPPRPRARPPGPRRGSLAGSSERGLSSVTMTWSACALAASPISGRLPGSRSPPAPNTTTSRPGVCSRSAPAPLSSAPGVWA
jgi:hypothetical protein